VARSSVTFELGGRRDRPLYLQIAHAVIEAVRAGRLASGDALPGTRQLAAELGVHRNTVKTAYAELAAQGWVKTRAASGTFISPDPPDLTDLPPPGELEGSGRVGFDLFSIDLPLEDAWAEDLAGARLAFVGIDPSLMPVKALARAYRHALTTRSANLLGYRPGRGHPQLLAALRAMIAGSRGIPGDRGLLVTRGSQMALSLVVQALLRPGDGVAIEDPGYAFCWPTFRLAGARLFPVSVDSQGLDVAGLERLVEREPIRAVLVTPHLHYPTGVRLCPRRRAALLELAERRRLIIIEDDWVNDVRYAGPPQLALASVDTVGVVLYLGSFSKLFAPSLRLGYVAGPEPVIDRLARLRPLIDVCGDSVLEAAMAELLEDGEVERHMRRLTRTYQARRDALMEALDAELAGVVRFDPPQSGSALWVQVDPDVDVEAWARESRARGVAFLTGRHFFFDQRPHASLWLSFAGLAQEDLWTAVRGMAEGLTQLRSHRPRGPRRPKSPGG
jgi:GntR family transcriptional regulator/MocR family aminotransferase